MATRAGMTALIARIRGLVNDPSASAHFTDEQIEAALDRRRREVVELRLVPVQSRTAGGLVEYKRFVADRAPFETGVTVLDASMVPVSSGVTADEMDGIWTFTDHQDAAYVSGLSFDLYGAAADLLDQWIAEGVSSGGSIVEWETDGQRVKRGAAETADRVTLANLYRRQSLPIVGAFGRSDLAPAGDGWTLRP